MYDLHGSHPFVAEVLAQKSCDQRDLKWRALMRKAKEKMLKPTIVHMKVSENGDAPKWIVARETPIKMDDLGVPPF